MTKPVIGVLYLQGAVTPHQPHIEAAGGVFLPVKRAEDFEKADAFILPGGESTTMLKLINIFSFWDILKKEFERKPVWGICAGAILMAQRVRNPEQKSFGLMDMEVTRNAYGRQLDSVIVPVNDYDVSYIRAPVIEKTGPKVEVLAQRENKPTWVLQKNRMATTFHPELTLDFPSPFHVKFTDMAKQAAT